MVGSEGCDTQAVGRRRFYLACIYGLSTIMGMALAVPAAVYLLFPPRSRKEDQWVEAAELSQLEVGVPEEVVFRHNRVDGWKISSEKTSAWVLKKSDTEVVAFAPQCTHLGCAYRWEESKKNFLCPCHTSNFDIEGKVIDGPAPRPLDRYLVRIEGKKLFLGPIQKSPEA
ncbi:MAG: ubiquinol-cytochrome c reductase iron-sulfur subunit [Acidobacteria bacterium]|nr:ubiquinol-cytochrome c reductase iron-sulfur subunit [Acidobacteriota bacterium]